MGVLLKKNSEKSIALYIFAQFVIISKFLVAFIVKSILVAIAAVPLINHHHPNTAHLTNVNMPVALLDRFLEECIVKSILAAMVVAHMIKNQHLNTVFIIDVHMAAVVPGGFLEHRIAKSILAQKAVVS